MNNKKKTRTNQFRQLFNYLLNLGRVTSESENVMNLNMEIEKELESE